MPNYDLLIRHGRVVTESGMVGADIAVADGRIVEIGAELAGSSRETVDATGLHILPGVIDAHVHFNEPGRTDWEGWARGTAALAAGGGTVACDMPLNATPPTLDAVSFVAKREAAAASARTDFALWGGLVPGNLDRLEELAACGVIGFKAFMADSGIADFPAADDLTLAEGMAQAAALGLVVAVHAESDTITRELARRAIAAGQTGVRDYLASRPVLAELEAINRAIFLAEQTGCALHIVHVSTGRGVALVAAARTRGLDITCETCPHYLVLTAEDVETLGAVAKCAPPVRPGAEREALWAALLTGQIDLVASDHSPSPPELKTGGDFFRVWGGIAGCQTLLPLLLTEGYHRRRVPLATIAVVTAGAVARRFRLPGKGRIAIGADADLALVDLAAEGTLTGDDLHARHRQSPFIGRHLQGRVVRTMLRGVTTMRDGITVGKPRGHLVRPASLSE